MKNPRVKTEKVIPATILEEPEKAKQDYIDITRAIELSDVLNVKPELTTKRNKGNASRKM